MVFISTPAPFMTENVLISKIADRLLKLWDAKTLKTIENYKM